jgi:hypothetical protein
MCAHILYCDEVGQVNALMETVELLEQWFMNTETDPDLAHCLVRYARSRGIKSLEEICRQHPKL